MLRALIISAALCVTTFAQLINAEVVAPAAEAVEWREVAANDLVAVHHGLADNSPFMVIQRDSAFPRSWLEAGYRIAQARLPRVNDAASAYWLLRGYAGGFRDAHIVLSATAKWPIATLTRAWPGFSTAFHGGAYYVAYTAEGTELPPVGARLLSCDGETPEMLARRRLDRFEGDLNLYGRFGSAYALLWDRGNPFVGPLPRRCQFEIGRRTESFALRYRDPNPDMQKQAIAASNRLAQSTLAIEQWNGGWWIGAPDFYTADWPAYIKTIKAHQRELREAPFVILDARGNGGGNSAYPEEIASILWGSSFADAHQPRLGDVVYRATTINRASYAKYLEQAEESHDVERVEAFREKVAQFDKAMARNEKTFTIASSEPRKNRSTERNPMHGKVIVLADLRCTSACLDMLDLFRAMPNVVQAGTKTNADTIFMDISLIDLPSGYFQLGYGHKAWVQRPRGSNRPYQPSSGWIYSGDLSSDADWKGWLSGRLRAPLK